jgi:hypothetical protein
MLLSKLQTWLDVLVHAYNPRKIRIINNSSPSFFPIVRCLILALLQVEASTLGQTGVTGSRFPSHMKQLINCGKYKKQCLVFKTLHSRLYKRVIPETEQAKEMSPIIAPVYFLGVNFQTQQNKRKPEQSSEESVS